MNTATPIPAHQKGKGAGLTVRPGWGTMVNDVIRTEGGVRRPPGPLWKTTRKSRSAKAFYPTADLRRAETMKAKFFYTGIRVKDLEASVEFYTTLLGMKVRGRNTVDAAKGTVVELVCEGEGGNTLELNYYEKGSSFDTTYAVGDGLDHLAFAVKDLDAALAEAAKAGHPVVLKMQEPGSRYAYIQDPNGIWIELAQFG